MLNFRSLYRTVRKVFDFLFVWSLVKFRKEFFIIILFISGIIKKLLVLLILIFKSRIFLFQVMLTVNLILLYRCTFYSWMILWVKITTMTFFRNQFVNFLVILILWFHSIFNVVSIFLLFLTVSIIWF